jgi:Ca2+-binding RTX toxin-like protein
MLGIFGLFGALLAGVLIDSLTQFGGASQDDTETDPETDAGNQDTQLSNIFHMLSNGEASAVSDASSVSADGNDAGTNTSNDTVAPPAEDLWLTGSDLTDQLNGGAGDDMIIGNDGDDGLAGADGNDLIAGDAGNDALNGGAGDDILAGGAGDDLLLGENGADSLDGGGDADTLHGCMGDDTLTGGAGDDSVTGGADQDSLFGNEGDDSLDGGAGNDQLAGGAGLDNLDGGAGNDTIWGQSESGDDHSLDFLNGGAGDDTLVLGAGDYGNGGEGADRFALMDIKAGDPPMQITDFNPQEDSLVVIYDPALHPDPQLTTQTSDAGVTLLLDGVAVANLQSLDQLDLNSIALQAA